MSDKQIISISLKSLETSKRYYLVSSGGARPFRFQWQNLRGKLLGGPGLDSIPPDFNKRKCLMYK